MLPNRDLSGRRLAVRACGVALGSAAGDAAVARVDSLCSWMLSVLEVTVEARFRAEVLPLVAAF